MTTFQTTHIVYFSPTHTSEKIARAIGEGIGMERRIETDLTLDESTSTIEINGSLTVLAAPVYGGRVAPVALRRMKRLKGTNAPAILAVVYGNRDYEDALVELRDMAIEQGFTPLSAGAFIGEHSYSTPALPVAMGRPDEADLSLARRFGAESLLKLERTNLPVPAFYVKGNVPYKPLMSGKPSAPVCTENCFGCGECVEVCPTHAIRLNAESVIETDISRCIRCCACVKACPNRARVYDNPFAAFLHANFSARREPEWFL